MGKVGQEWNSGLAEGKVEGEETGRDGETPERLKVKEKGL